MSGDNFIVALFIICILIVLLLTKGKKDDKEADVVADLVHRVWARWMRYLFSKGAFNDDGSFTIEPKSVKRWQRQMGTAYNRLPEKEKNSDVEIALEYIALIEKINKG